MSTLEDVELFLPRHLSEDQRELLVSTLEKFPQNFYAHAYSAERLDTDEILQGDGLVAAPVGFFPKPQIRDQLVMVLSNTCDVDPENKRIQPSIMQYSPVLSAEGYEAKLKEEGVDDDRVRSHLAELKNQKISNALFLPKGGRLEKDAVVFIDRTISISVEELDLSKLA